jgi:hypothetical protein
MNFQAGDFFNLNFNRKQFKTSEGASPRFRLPSCGRFEVEVEVEVAVAVEKSLLYTIPDLRFTRMRPQAGSRQVQQPKNPTTNFSTKNTTFAPFLVKKL